jgi:ABC-type multidrug transport system fused ATPase/permease subunit
MIYNKSLKYSTLANKKFSEAEIINYSQTDVERMTYAGFQLAAIFYGPIQIIFALIMMYVYVGVPFFSGVGVILVLMGINYFLSKRVNYYNEEVLKAKDERMKVVEEMLDIIRFIKISTIEKFFFNKIELKREKEISLYLKKGLLFVVIIFNFWIACPLLLSATFVTYVMMGNVLSSQIAFTMIMLSNVLEYPIHSLPTAVS